MQEEIFGPILPVLTYEKLEDALSWINQRPKPLAHTAFSYTAKRHLTGSKMNQCVVDAATAKPAPLQNRFLPFCFP